MDEILYRRIMTREGYAYEPVELLIKVSHPSLKIQEQGAKALLGFIKVLSKLTGEKVEIKKILNPSQTQK